MRIFTSILLASALLVSAASGQVVDPSVRVRQLVQGAESTGDAVRESASRSACSLAPNLPGCQSGTHVAPATRYEAGVPRPSVAILRARALLGATKAALNGCKTARCEGPTLNVLTGTADGAAGAVASCPTCSAIGSSVAVATARGLGTVTKTEVLRVLPGVAHPRVISVTGRTGARLSAAEAATAEDALIRAVTSGESTTLGRTAAEAIVKGVTGKPRLVPELAPRNGAEKFFKVKK